MKLLFTLKPHSIIDVITNSSSELFVGKNQEKKHMVELIEAVYPKYLDDYFELKNIDEISFEDLDIYISYYCSPHVWPAEKTMYPILPGFTFDELYEPATDYQTGKIKEPAWNGKIQYRLKTNSNYEYVTESNFDEVKRKIDPNKEMYFLFSKDDNPNWEMQEKLESFMTRYHLG